MNDVYFSHESASAMLKDAGNGALTLSNVYAKRLGQGHGSGVMQKVVEYADKGGYVLKLRVLRYGYSSGTDAMTNAELTAFYARFGFVQDPESAPNRHIHMVRKPASQEKHAL